MAKILFSAFFFLLTLSLSAGPSKQLLLEAEVFQNRGGWVIDPQFTEQMGSPYLLAHGMGNPVENAKTTVEFPSTGSYNVWVRTKNWIPGDWDAPGRFNLIVNGKRLETILGTEKGWNWKWEYSNNDLQQIEDGEQIRDHMFREAIRSTRQILTHQSASVVVALPFSGKDVLLSPSWLKDRESLNTKYLHQLDPDRLLHNFRVNAGIKSDTKPLEGWESPQCGLRGHFVGHYLSACASLIAHNHDILLDIRCRYVVDVLDECQQKLGGKYLSAFPESEFETLEKKYGGVWAPYYTYHKIMQGLLDIYILTGNRKAYRVLLNMADFVKNRMDKLPDTEIEKILFTAEANPTNEAGGMNEVLHNLYAVSKDTIHLRLAAIFDRKWFSQPLAQGKDILSGLHSNTHIALINGYASRTENTQESFYRDAAVNFWDILTQHHCYVNGSSSGPRPIATTPTSRIAEHWGVADHLSATLTGEIAESCVTHNTQKLTSNVIF